MTTPHVRSEEITFTSSSDHCAAWLVTPGDAAGPRPCVVLAHGLGATRHGRLAAFAERFAQAGFAALVFDYRFFGDSGGEPRQVVDIPAQLDDWRAAIAYARTLPGVDPARIALWGTSFSGGHVTLLAAEDPTVAAVISMNPFLDGRHVLRSTPPAEAGRLAAAGLRDLVGAVFGRRPHLVPAIGAPGSTAAMTGPGAVAGFEAMFPIDERPSTEIAARILLRIPHYRPVRRAARVRAPWLIQAGLRDDVTGMTPARTAASVAPQATLRTYEGDHFAPYVGEVFERVVDTQIEFLHEHLGT